MTNISGQVRVLHLITELVLGGAQDNTFLTVEGLPRKRFEVHLAGRPHGNWEQRAREVADQVHLIPSMKRGIYALQNFKALFEIIALLRQHDYHIIHTHSTNAGILGRVAARMAGVPIVVHTVHGFPFNDLTFSPFVRGVLVWLERITARLSDRLLMVSELNRAEALERKIAPDGKMVTVHSGIAMHPFEAPVNAHAKRKALGIHNDSPVVGMVGRLAEYNAPAAFIDAAHKVLDARPDVNFLVVGDGHLRPDLEAMVNGRSRIRFLGYRSDVPQILPVMDVFVFPVLWGGLGRSLTEAMIAGRPVVASAVNGVPEIVHHGETGLLVPPGDPEAIAKEVMYLLDHPAVAHCLGANARAEVVPEFSAELMVARIAALYEQLLAEKGMTSAGR